MGNSAVKVMDIIDHYVLGRTLDFSPISREQMRSLPSDVKYTYKKWVKFNKKAYILYRFIHCVRPNKFLLLLYKIYKKNEKA